MSTEDDDQTARDEPESDPAHEDGASDPDEAAPAPGPVVPELLPEVTPDQLMDVARRILAPENAVMAVVGPFKDDSVFTSLL